MTKASPKKWSITEEQQLLKQVESGLSDEFIAEKHNRSIGAIAIRRRQIALNMMTNGATEHDILLLTRVTPQELENQKKYNTRKNKGGDEDDITQIRNSLQELHQKIDTLIKV